MKSIMLADHEQAMRRVEGETRRVFDRPLQFEAGGRFVEDVGKERTRRRADLGGKRRDDGSLPSIRSTRRRSVSTGGVGFSSGTVTLPPPPQTETAPW